MFDMASIQGAVTGLKTAGDIAKSFLELKSMAEMQGKVIDLQRRVSRILCKRNLSTAAASGLRTG